MATNNLYTSEAFHPGEYLKDELDTRGISQAQLAREIGMTPSVLNEIIKGKRAVTAEYALLFEAALGIEADFWINLQSRYSKQRAISDTRFAQRLARVRKITAVL